MSIIDCTLFVQIINFFIAFFLIKYYLFKPALLQIHAEDALQNSLIGMVQEHQGAIAHKEQELALHWQNMRAYFAQNTPSLKPEPLFMGKKVEIILPEFDSQVVAQAAQQLKNTIIKKIEHVH